MKPKSDKNIYSRLWALMKLISYQGCDMPEIVRQSGVNERLVKDGIKRLKQAGIPIKYSRKDDTYKLDWPSNPIKVELSPKALFLLKLATSAGEEVGKELELIDKMIESPDALPIFDQGPAYGIGQGIQPSLRDHFKTIQKAKKDKTCVTFLYHSRGNKVEIRVVEPVYLYHTPVSWYLIAFCTEKQDFRSFKLARMEHIKSSPLESKDRPFNLREFLGDSWWIQKGDCTVDVKILFTGESAKAILEYRFHASQKHEITEEGTLVTWQLSYLEEFTSWLMQWIGNFKVIEPAAINDIIRKKIQEHKE